MTDNLLDLLHREVCAIQLGILTHVDGSNESPHDGEHKHPWPCERIAQALRDKNLHLTVANWTADGPHVFAIDPETGDEWPINSTDLITEEEIATAINHAMSKVPWPGENNRITFGGMTYNAAAKAIAKELRNLHE